MLDYAVIKPRKSTPVAGFYPFHVKHSARVISRVMKGRGSGKDILKRIDRRLAALGLSDRAASLKAGRSADAIRSIRRQIEDGTQRGISSDTLEAFAPVLETTSQWLLAKIGPETRDGADSEEPPEPGIPIKGWVGAGSHAQYYPEETDLDLAPMIAGATPQTVALEIRGTSLGELFDRWVVYYDDVRSPVTPDLIGKLCVVGLPDGNRLVKKLKRARGGLFDLISNTEEPIRNAAVEWAAKVKLIGPQ